MPQHIIQSASVRLIINGAIIGFATGISWSRSKGTKAIREIDSPYVAEYMDSLYTCQGSLSGIRLRTDMKNLETNGIMPLDKMTSIFNVPYCSLELVDRGTGNIIAKFNNVAFDNDSWQVSTRGIVTFSCNFQAMFVESQLD